ncbi:MAG: hypothetical protein ABW185_11875 [Sedimenticola sp.]
MLRSGQLLVECDKKAHSDNLLRSKILAHRPIKVTPHKTLNYSKGIIRSRDLLDCSENEILSNLSDQGVTDVRRISVTKNGTRVPTRNVILTFNTPDLPTSIKAGYLRITVEVYVPNPLRCFRCQRFGHHKDNCKTKAVCASCGEDDHGDAACSKPVHCVNCQGDHDAYSRDCPTWKKEKEVQKIRVTESISFPEARKVLDARTPIATIDATYASKVAPAPANPKVGTPKRVVTSVLTQTDMHWPNGALNPTYTLLPHIKTITPTSLSTSSTQTSSQSESVIVRDRSPEKSSGAKIAPATLPAAKSVSNGDTDKAAVKKPATKAVPDAVKPPKSAPNRQPKGSEDPIRLHNKYGELMDTAETVKPPLPPKLIKTTILPPK